MSAGGFIGTKLFVIPKCAPTNYRGLWSPAGRKQVIDLDKPDTDAKYYGENNEWLVVTWPGTGGYWRRVVQYNGEFTDRWPS